MKSELQERLANLAPQLVITTSWKEGSHPWFDDMFNKGSPLEGEDPREWTCWEARIRVTHASYEEGWVEGTASLGDVWIPKGKDPFESHPDINGRERFMIFLAVRSLGRSLPEGGTDADKLQIELVIEELKKGQEAFHHKINQ